MSPGSPGPRSPGSATGIDEGVKEFLSRRLDHTWFPHLFAGRHVPGRAGGAPGGPPGPGGGHRRVGPGPPGDPGTWPWGTPRPAISGRPCLAVPARTGAQGPLPPRPRGRGPGLPVTPTPASAPRSGRSCPGPPGSAAAPRFARTITTRAGPDPPPSPRAPWSPRSSPRPRPRPSPPSTSTSSTLRGTPSLQNRPDADRRRAGPDRIRRPPQGAPGQDPAAATPSSALGRQTRRRADVAPGPPRQRLRTPPDRLRPARATRSGSTANDATSPRPSLRHLTDMLHTDNSTGGGTGGRPTSPAITT